MRQPGPGLHALPVCCHTFAFATAAVPARVWSALTDPDRTAAYLFGLGVHSSWRPGAAIRLLTSCGQALSGEVLYAQAPHRLSYVLRSGPADPPVYLTWRIRPCPTGSAVHLLVDEPTVDPEESEDTWLPVLAALQDLLAPDGYAD